MSGSGLRTKSPLVQKIHSVHESFAIKEHNKEHNEWHAERLLSDLPLGDDGNFAVSLPLHLPATGGSKGLWLRGANGGERSDGSRQGDLVLLCFWGDFLGLALLKRGVWMRLVLYFVF